MDRAVSAFLLLAALVLFGFSIDAQVPNKAVFVGQSLQHIILDDMRGV